MNNSEKAPQSQREINHAFLSVLNLLKGFNEEFCRAFKMYRGKKPHLVYKSSSWYILS